MRTRPQQDDSGPARRWCTAAALALLAGLAACSGGDVDLNRTVSNAFQSWCRNAPDHCTTTDAR
jgi:hypothetical protein